MKIECRVEATRKPGRKTHHAGAAGAIGQGLGDHGEDGGDPAVHDRGAEAADHPQGQASILEDEEIARVLDQGETGADRKTEDGGVDEKADPPPEDQENDHRSFEELLDGGGDDPDQPALVDPGVIEDDVVEGEARNRGEGSGGDEPDHPLGPDELVAVEQDQNDEERKHRQQTEEDSGAGFHGGHAPRLSALR